MSTQSIGFSSLISRDVFQSGILSDQSQIDLKSYFVGVKLRYESGDEFPYDLVELVPTVFTRKDIAVDSLKNDFTQGIDFTGSVSRRSDDNPNPPITYRLSPLAFEFMVARKSKDVFSLYHTIFHLKTTPPTLSTEPVDLDLMIQQNAMIGKAIIELKSQREAMQAIQRDVSDIKAALPTAKTHTTIRAYAATHNIRLAPRVAQRLGKRYSHITINQGLAINAIPDDLYGTVNAYPNAIIHQVFTDEFGGIQQKEAA